MRTTATRALKETTVKKSRKAKRKCRGAMGVTRGVSMTTSSGVGVSRSVSYGHSTATAAAAAKGKPGKGVK